MTAAVNLQGKEYGHWRVTAAAEPSPRGERKWLCRCVCGTERPVLERSLLSGRSLSCGCMRTEHGFASHTRDLTGKVFGNLTVQHLLPNRGANGSLLWQCLCTCGGTCTVSTALLTSGRKTHCGCRTQRRYHYTDITGQRFGRLTALYPTSGRTRRGGVVWHCRCDCGNEQDISYNDLAFTALQSCGCQKQEHNSLMPRLPVHVAGTSVDHLKSKKLPSSNTTGYKGVYRIRNRYTAKIVFQQKQYYFGSYESAEEAAQARREAEEIFAESTVHYYERWKARADEDPVWAAGNPVQIHVEHTATGHPFLTFLPVLD